jgi:hypothetical protein
MKNTLIALLLSLFTTISYSQATILPDSLSFKSKRTNTVDTIKPVFLYESGFQYDSLYKVSFSWFSGRGSLRINTGYLVQAFKMFSREYDIKGREVLVHDEYYIIGDDGIRYYLNGIMIDNIIMDSKRIPNCNWFKKLFGCSPRIVWELRILDEIDWEPKNK